MDDVIKDILQKDVLLGLAILFAPLVVETFRADWRIGIIAFLMEAGIIALRSILKVDTIRKNNPTMLKKP